MKTSFFKLLKMHLRIGYVSALFLFTAPLLILMAWDLYDYRKAHLSLQPVFLPHHLEAVMRQGAWQQVAGTLVVYLLVFPGILAILRVLQGRRLTPPGYSIVRRNIVRLLGIRGAWVVCFYVLVVLLIALFIPAARNMEVVSGLASSSGNQVNGVHYYFTSLFNFVVQFFWKGGYLLIAAAILAKPLIEIVRYFVGGAGSHSGLIKDYPVRCFLADLQGELYPTGGRHNLNFNAIVLTPETRYVTDRVEGLMSDYYHKLASGDDAAGLLMDYARESKDLLKKLLWGSLDMSGYKIEYFPGTSRAFEMALLRTTSAKRIILSPFEHPTEEYVSTWHSEARGITVDRIPMDPSDFSKTWGEQKHEMINWLRKHLTDSSITTLFVISEVCYATGLEIPVKDLCRSLHDDEDLSKMPIRLLVDGAHSVGNGQRDHAIAEADFFVFSGHKWLLSPEPCGVLVSRTNGRLPQDPYDSWTDSVPQSTGSPRLVASLLASLKLLDQIGPSNIWLHSQELRERFEQRLAPQNCPLRIVGPTQDQDMKKTFMLAVSPKNDRSWRYPASGLRDHFRENYLHVSVIELDGKAPWVRIAFPYFLDDSHIEKLHNILMGAI